MANCYTFVAAENLIPCSEEDFRLLEELLVADTLRADEEDCASHGLVVRRLEGRLHMHDDCGGDPEAVGPETRNQIGVILRKAGLKYWEFGVAYTCDKARPGSYGGDAFMFTDEGRLVWRQCFWPTDDEHWIVVGRIPYDDEDEVMYVPCRSDQNPVEEFIRRLYEARGKTVEGLELMSEDGLVRVNPETEESFAYINASIRIPGPPLD